MSDFVGKKTSACMHTRLVSSIFWDIWLISPNTTTTAGQTLQVFDALIEQRHKWGPEKGCRSCEWT